MNHRTSIVFASRWLRLALLLGAGACSAGEQGASPATDTTVDGSAADGGQDAVDVDAGTAPDGLDEDAEDGAADATGDVAADAGAADVDQPAPQACGVHSACNRPLLGDGTCPGACLPQPQGPHCDRAPQHALCHVDPVVEPKTATVTVGDVTVEPLQWPAQASTGETHTLRFALTRAGQVNAPVALTAVAGPHWQIIATSFTQGGSIAVGGQPVVVEVTVLAKGWDLYDHAHDVAVLQVDGQAVAVYSVLSYAGPGAVACGGHSFPSKWSGCLGGGECSLSYPQSRCCGGVFYPSAACCVDADCPIGTCADGRCIRRTPDKVLGRSMISGHVRVLWVIANEPGVGTADLCDDEQATLADKLGLDTVEAVFTQFLAARLGAGADVAVPLKMQWRVLAGLQVNAIDDDKSPSFEQWLPQVVQALTDAGCQAVTFDDYDIVILSHPKLYLHGYGGRVFPLGKIGLRSIDKPLLTAHEIVHTFGAGDLYGDIAVKLHWDHALMGTNTYGDKPVTDDVCWAEIGLGDVDRNGVIDLVEFASAPDGLLLEGATAVLEGKGPSLHVLPRIRASEGATTRRVYFDAEQFQVELVGTDAVVGLDAFLHEAVFEGAIMAGLDLQVGGKIGVRVTGKHVFTGEGFARKTLALDQTVEVEIKAP